MFKAYARLMVTVWRAAPEGADHRIAGATWSRDRSGNRSSEENWPTCQVRDDGTREAVENYIRNADKKSGGVTFSAAVAVGIDLTRRDGLYEIL